MLDFEDISRSPRFSVREAATGLRERAAGESVRRDFIFEQYLNRLPVALLFVSTTGELLFGTPDGRKELARWNRGLPAASGLGLPENIDRLLDRSAMSRVLHRKREAMICWSAKHPRLQNLHVRLDECHRSQDDEALAGYWVTFLDHAPEQAEADLSANALVALQGLSPSERKVAALVARGMTNGQVASAIARSIRTVEYQLHSVYKKLGVKGRTQLAIALN